MVTDNKELSILGKIEGTKIKLPLPLLVKEASKIEKESSQQFLDNTLDFARNAANDILEGCRINTGSAILGRPPPEILVDKKSRGNIKRFH